MSLPDRERTLSTLAVIALAAVLVLLGILQYRWSARISEAASTRMQADLQKSMMAFRQAFTRELGDVCLSLQPPRDKSPEAQSAQYSRQLLQWQRSSVHGELVKHVYVAQETVPGKPLRLLRLDARAGKFSAVDWPSDFGTLPARLQETAPPPSGLKPRTWPPPPKPGPRPAPPPGDKMPWAIDPSIPALVHPIQTAYVAHGKAQPAAEWVIIELDRAVLERHLLPELARRQFSVSGQMDFKVAVLGGSPQHPNILYSSDPGFGEEVPLKAAGILNLWGPPGPPDAGTGQGPPGGVPGQAAFRPEPLHPEQHANGFWEPVRLVALHHSADDRDWQLVVAPRIGSLEEAVAHLRRRNLAVSFGILLVLAGTIGVIVITTHRARKLAQIQMDFVTGVTHELRTPLAVILSAAENIKDGVISKPLQLERYGGIILRQTRQLMQLVEQVLLFASTRQWRLHYDVQPVELPPIIEVALENAGAEGAHIERDLEPNLPLVEADPVALTQCLQNLVANAIKYGGADRWIGVKAWTSEGKDTIEVNVQIADHGIGINSAELPHIFEPFYRSPSVTASNVHGTGLGLPLAKSLVEALGGRISVNSQPGQGTSFTLHLRTVTTDDSLADAQLQDHNDSTVSL